MSGFRVKQPCRRNPETAEFDPTGHLPDRNPAAQQSPALRRCAILSVGGADRACLDPGPPGLLRGDPMKRRKFITLLGGMVIAWPLAAQTQQPTTPVIGFIRNTTRDDLADLLKAMHQGLRQTGYVEGRNVTVEYRFADNQLDRLPTMAADLVRRQVAVIVTGGDASSFAAKAATTTIPVIFSTGFDPIEIGLVTSLSRPGGNVTGVSFFSTLGTAAKRTRSPGPADPEEPSSPILEIRITQQANLNWVRWSTLRTHLGGKFLS